MLHVPVLPLTVPASRVRGAAALFSNQVAHLDEALLDGGRCALVRVEGIPGRVGAYCKTELRAVRFLPAGAAFERLASLEGEALEAGLVEALVGHLEALRSRKRMLVLEGAFRLAHGEADGMPGLVIDDYEALLVVQSSAPAGDFLLPFVARALWRAAPGRPVFERSSGQTRSLAGLPERTRALSGTTPEEVESAFAGLTLSFSPRRAQKTGLFLDQRTNLELLAGLLRGRGYRDLLDVCCYAGAWAATGAFADLRGFTLVDQDKEALARAEQNVRANAGANATSPSGGAFAVDARHGDMFEILSVLAREGKSFDVVVGDPPAFAKSKKHLPEARRAYARLTKLAARLVRPGGLYVACSCSRNMEETEFQRTVEAQLQADAPGAWDLVLRGHQAADHTVPAGDVLSSYLKCYFYRRREAGA